MLWLNKRGTVADDHVIKYGRDFPLKPCNGGLGSLGPARLNRPFYLQYRGGHVAFLAAFVSTQGSRKT